MQKDPYVVLQVAYHAEQEVIEAAYRRLARKYHPDVNRSPQANARMQAINWAYEVLKDPVRRAEYDRRRERQQDWRENYPPPPPREERQHRPPPRQQPEAPRSSTESQEGKGTSESQPPQTSVLISLAFAVLLLMSSYGLTFAFGQILAESRAHLLYIPSLIGLLWSLVIAIVGAHGWKPGQATIFRFFIALVLSVFPVIAWIPCYWSGKAIVRWIKRMHMGEYSKSDVSRPHEKSQPRWPVAIYGVVATGLAMFVFGDVASIIEFFDKGTEVTATPITVYVSTYQGPGITMKYPTAWELEAHLDENSISVWDPSHCCFILLSWGPVTVPEGVDPEMLYRQERETAHESVVERWGHDEGFEILREYRLGHGPVFEFRYRDEEGVLLQKRVYSYHDVETGRYVIWGWTSCDSTGEDAFSYCLALEDELFDVLAQSVIFEPTSTSALIPTDTPTVIPTPTSMPTATPTPTRTQRPTLTPAPVIPGTPLPPGTTPFDPNREQPGYTYAGDAFCGSDEAEIGLIEFVDFQSARNRHHFLGDWPDLEKEYVESGKVRFIVKHFPALDHAQGFTAAEAAECAGQQGAFCSMYDLLFTKQEEWSQLDDVTAAFKEYAAELDLDADTFATCLDEGQTAEKVMQDFTIGQDNQFPPAPQFFIFKGEQGGYVPLDQLQEAIGELLGEPTLTATPRPTETPSPTATPRPAETSRPGVSRRDELLDAVTVAREAARSIAWDMDKCVTLRREDCGDFDMVMLRYEELLAAPTFTVGPDLQYVYKLYREAVDGILAKGGDMYNCVKNDCPTVPFITWGPARTAIEEAERKFNDAIVLLGGIP